MVAKSQRSMALDVFRGIAIAGMILVNNPGDWAHVYAPLLHAKWHGCTPTDLVFPFFLFATGAGMCFSFAATGYRATPGVLAGVARRSALLVLLGILLVSFPYTAPLSEWRLPGVLQRIGVAYALAALLVLYCPDRWRAALAVALLLGYWALLYALGSGDPYSLQGNIVRRVDLAIFGASHLYHGFGVAFDPEGLLSTLPSVVSVLAGFEAARILRAGPRSRALLLLVAGGAGAVALGLYWHQWLPINKPLWTSSYVLYTGGIGWLTLAGLVLVLDVLGLKWLGRPLQFYGTNPLFVYILSGLLARTLLLVNVGEVSLKSWLFQQLALVASPVNASLLFALAQVLLFWLLSWWLYRRDIIIRL